VSEKNRTPMEDAALALYYHAAQLIKEGRSQDAIVRELVKRGVSSETARKMLAKLEQSQVNVAQRSGYRNVLIGTTLMLLMLIPLFGIGVDPVAGTYLSITILFLGGGLFALGRGILQILGL